MDTPIIRATVMVPTERRAGYISVEIVPGRGQQRKIIRLAPRSDIHIDRALCEVIAMAIDHELAYCVC